MRKLLIEATLWLTILQLKNKSLPYWARAELEGDKQDLERALSELRQTSRRTRTGSRST